MQNKNITLYQGRSISELSSIPANINDIIYCIDNETLYQKKTGIYNVDDQFIVNTIDTNQYWVGIAGKYNTNLNKLNNQTGFANISDSNISYDYSTGEFYIEPSSNKFDIFINGDKYEITGITQVYHDIDNIDYSGVYYIYFDNGGGLNIERSDGSNYPDSNNSLLVATIWYDGDTSYGDISDDRYLVGADNNLRNYLHKTQGLKKESGLSISGYTELGPNTQSNLYGISNGYINNIGNKIYVNEIVKGDLAVNYNQSIPIGTSTPYVIVHRANLLGDWIIRTNQYTPYIFTNNGYLNYDNGVLVESISSNWYINYYIIATTFNSEMRLFNLVGQQYFTDELSAYSENITDLDLTGLNLENMICLYQITYKTGEFNQIGRCQISRVSNVDSTIFNYGIISGGGGASSHLLLTELNGGVYEDGGHDNLIVSVISTINPAGADSDYKLGTIWFNINTSEFSVLYDNTPGGAVWNTYGGSIEHSNLANRDVQGNHAKLIPHTNTTTAIQITKANGTTAVANFDTLNGITTLNNILTVNQNGKVGIGVITPGAILDVGGGVRVADDVDTPDLNKVGTLRYRTDTNNSYCEMCMQTGVGVYAWIVIHTNTW